MVKYSPVVSLMCYITKRWCTNTLLVGLLPVESTRTQDYTHIIGTEISIRDHLYTWTVTQDVPKGKYRLGVGFFYHETTQNEIHII